jgi:hypothetical protein
MNCPALRILLVLGAAALTPPLLTASGPAKDQEMLNQAKILMWEQKWDAARETFQRLIRDFPQSTLLAQAYYQSAYCSRLQRKPEEALLAYELFLQKYPKEPTLATEAGKAIVDLAVPLVEQGKAAYRSRLVTALGSPNKEVRYFAAIRSSSLKDQGLNTLCIPVLKEIRANEKQPEVVNPASIALLRIDPAALAKPDPPRPSKGTSKQGDAVVKMFYIQIFDQGEGKKPTVEMNFPVTLAQLAITALDEATKAEMRKNGFDVENVWESIKRLSPTNILTVRAGSRVVKIWIK